jgi:hypothetical protein
VEEKIVKSSLGPQTFFLFSETGPTNVAATEPTKIEPNHTRSVCRTVAVALSAFVFLTPLTWHSESENELGVVRKPRFVSVSRWDWGFLSSKRKRKCHYSLFHSLPSILHFFLIMLLPGGDTHCPHPDVLHKGLLFLLDISDSS